MKFKTEPNLGTRGIILPVLGEVKVERGIIDLTPEDWKKIAKLDFGIKLVNVDGTLESEEDKEDEIDKTEKGEPLLKPIEVEPLNPVETVEDEVVDQSTETESEPEDEIQKHKGDPNTATQENTPEVVEGQLTFDELMALKRDDLRNNALQLNELNSLGLEKEIKSKNKKALSNFILENI